MRVLVVDDEEASRYLLETLLGAHGIEVDTAADGEKALASAKSHRPDAIVTDILMPNMDGYQLCVRLKSDQDLRDVPIMVYTSSFGDPEDKSFALSLGVDTFLIKPQEPDTLLTEVLRLLGVTGARRLTRIGPATDLEREPRVLQEYGERISHKLYQKLLELEKANADLSSAMRLLNAEVREKSRLVDELSRAIANEREAEDALAVSQERFAAAIRGANDGIWDWDMSTGAFFASPRFRALLGIPEDEECTTVDQWLARIAPSDMERVRFELDLHVRGLTPHFESEYQVLDPDGYPRWMDSRGQALRREDGTPYRMAGSLTDITERKRQEEQLLSNAFYDDLTGLPNRALFMDRASFLLSRLQRDGGYAFGMLVLDIDRFKTVNDSLGHVAGDELLTEVSGRIRTVLHTGDTLSRLGGDEFGVLMDDLNETPEAAELAARILEVLSTPFDLGAHEVFASASIGIAKGLPTHSGAEDLFREADTAMYRAKEAGRGRFEVFDPVMHRAAVSTLRIEAELRRALERDELEPYFQPVVELKSGRVVGCEALVRWNHPERGVLGPYDFLPVAEETGLIVGVGEAVLRGACARLREWNDAGLPRITVAVNVSVNQMLQDGLVETVRSVLQETGVDPASLELEVTESVVMKDPDAVGRKLQAIADLGVSLSIDDFGTGYSSLGYLKRFPFSALKIDRSFVMDLPEDADDGMIVEAVISLAHSLKMRVIAEGVETEEQREFLVGRGAECMQGFLVSPPVTAGAFRALLEQGVVLPPLEPAAAKPRASGATDRRLRAEPGTSLDRQRRHRTR
jgi:diguanylate cyclase (GGDEF)-like protein/PAS domain S-box-containing protein